MKNSTMTLRAATEADSDKLKEFYSSQSLPGLLQFSTERQGSFFSKYRLLTNDFTTFILEDDNEVLGCATLCFTPAVIDGKVQIMGYATDLRLKRTRKAVIRWSEEFLPVIMEERKKRKCKYIFSCVGKSHIQSYNAFIRPRTMRPNFPRYHQYRDFNVVTIHGQYPFAPQTLKTIDVAPAELTDIPELQAYIKSHQQQRTIFLPGKSHNLLEIIRQWPGLRIEDFLVARDREKNIIGCVAAWDPSNVELFRPIKKSKRVVTFESTLYFLSYLGVTRPLHAKNSPYLGLHQLNFINANNPDIFHSLVHFAYKTIPKNHFLIYMHFEHQLNYFPPAEFISTKIPYGLYCLLGPDDKIPKFLTPAFTEDSPEFECAYI